jgi:hypothetical protein
MLNGCSLCKFVSEFNGGDGVIYKFLDLFNFNNHQNPQHQPHHTPQQPHNNQQNNENNENNDNMNDNDSVNSNDFRNHKTRFSGYNYSPRITRKNNNFGLSS